MDKKLPTHRPKTLNALKAVLPIMAMATPLANASIRPASISRNGLNTRAAISQYEKTDTEQKSQAFGAFGSSHYVQPASRQVDSEALAFLSENNFLAGGEDVGGDTSGDISGLTGRKSFLSCVTAGGAPAYYTTGDPIISDSICTILGYTWTSGDNLPPVFPKDNPGVFLTDISLAVGGNITLDFEIEDPPITGANYLDVINVTVTSDNQSAIRNADISVTRDPGTSPGNLFYLTIANVVGQGGANITVTATDDRNNSATDTFFVNTGAVPVMANPPISITVLEDSGSNAVNVSNFATADSDSGQTLTWSASGGSKGTPQASGTASTPTTNATPTSVTYTPQLNANGSDNFGVLVSDGTNIDSRFVSVTITPVNDEPTISSLANQTFNGVGGSAQTVVGFASMSSAGGGADENTQTVLGYLVSEVSDPSGVITSVSIASNGTLTYTPTANVEGVATIQAQVRDSGGVTNGGDDLSQLKTFTITVDTLAPSLSEVTAVTSPTNDPTPDVTIYISQAGTLAVGGSCGSASEGAIAAGNQTITLTQPDNSTPFVDGTYSDCTVTVTDANGNASSALTLSAFQIQLDAIPPTVTQVTAPVADTYMTGETLSFTLTANEVLTVDTASGTPALDLTIGSSNVSAAYVSGTGSDTLTFSYTVQNNDEDTDGISIDSLSLNSGAITDVAGNAIVTALNGVANTTGVLVDGVQPTVAITGASGNINAAFTATITFSENVTGFDVSDIVAANATLSGFAGTGSSYTVLVTPTADGAVTLDVASAAAVDLAGNSNTAATQLSADFDGSVPTVAITGASGFINSAFTATITFSEDVTGFDVSDIVASNATLSAFAGSGSTYTVLVTPNADGAVALNVAGAVAVDVANNSNTAAAELAVTYDATVPTVALSGASGNINAAFTATITFSEDVTGFNVTDITAGNATLSAFSGSGSTYTVLVTPTADGAVTLDVAGAVSTDVAGNSNTAAPQLMANFDGSLPTVAITGASGFINSAFTATINFSEDVTGFDISDIAVSNATLSGFTGTGSSYTVLVTPTADGAVTLDVASDVAVDIANNGNTAATQLTATYDVEVPTVAISGATGNINAPFTATITFSEDVTGFDVTDITTGNATLSGFAGTGSSYTVLVTPTADGEVTLDVAAAIALDVANNSNTAATQLSATFDGTVPTVAISGASGNINTPFTATITFSEDVTGFDVSDIAVTNATLSGFTGTGSTYTVFVTPTADGAVTLDVAAAAALDVANNSNTAATQLAVNFDATVPTVAISGASGFINSAFTATITFSEAVTGFNVADIVASNATLSSFSGSGSVYTVLVTPTADGAVTLDVAGAVAVDVANNSNTAAAELAVTYDATVPTVAITGASGNINAAFTATITFSEDVTGFNVTDITAGNATLSAFSGSGSTYTVLVTPTANGTVTLDVAGAVSTDVAGNSNTAAPQLTANFDGSLPTVAITGASGFINSAFTATITFSEDVTGFDISDIAASNATLSAFAGSGSTYTVLVTPATDGEVTLDVASDVAVDIADNGNTAATQLSATYDVEVPTVAISGATGNINAPFTATISFSEDVTGFDVTDIAASNATLSGFAGTGSSYTVLVTPTADGEVTMDVAAAVALDVASNSNTAASQLAVNFDGTVPTVAISGASGNINAPFTATITFSEGVTGFDVSDIAVSNATLSGFTGTGSTYTVLVTPTADGAVTLDVAAAVALDIANNSNTAASQLAVNFDATVPTVAISGASGFINSAFTATITFSEAVTGFDVSDIVASNATLSAFAGSGSTYTVLVTPSVDGAVALNVLGAVAVDVANNSNTAASPLTATYDATAPSVAISGASGDINAAFTATITFSEDVTGFDVSDISATNATLSVFAGSGSIYTVLVTPTADGPVALDVAAAVALDVANNSNIAAPQLTATYDGTAPTLVSFTRFSPSTENTAADNVSWTVTFSEAVSGVTPASFTLTGTTAMSAMAPVNASTYQVTASGGDLASLNGVVGLNLSAAAAISDSAGNVLAIAEPATDETFTLDNTAPTTSVSAPSVTATASADVTYTVTYADADSVTLTPSDIVLNKTGTADATVAVTGSGAATRTVTLSGITGDGTLGITVPAGTAADAVSNPAEAGGTSATFSVDNTLPTVAVTAPVNSPDAFPITITFSEVVTGFVDTEITATNATVSDFAGSGTTYTATVTPTAPGTDVTLEIAAGVSEDAVGNLNEVSPLVTVTTNSSGSVSINGFAVEGQTLTAIVVDPDNITNTITYQWTSTGATATVVGGDETYVIQTSDIGNTLTVDVSYVDDANFAETAVSLATATVISIEQNAWNNITDSVGAISAAPTFDDYRNVGLSELTDDELTRILSILNRAVNQQVADGDIDELSELEALVDAILEGQDDDLDGLPNMLEDDGLADTDRDGIDDRDDVDADNDGIRDNLEIDALVDMADDDSDGIVNLFDFDVDGDGFPDFRGYTDANLNGVIDEFETLSGFIAAFAPTPVVSAPVVSAAALATVAAKTAEVDTDGDGIINSLDIDADGDGVFDLIEAGLPDADENALVDAGTAIITDYADLPDTDVDGIADFLQLKSNGTDTDLSLGGVLAALDLDLDGVIDVTTDVDLDGLADVVDNAIGAFGSAKDFDGDGIPNHLDPDDDNDNRSDVDENAELAQFFTGEDADGDGIDDGFDALINGVANGVDANGNGVRDDRELPDLDGDGIVDYLDDDADNDGIRDDIDTEIALPVDLAPGATLDDLDGDGVLDTVDPSVNTGVDVKVASKGSMSLGILMLLGGVLILMRRRTRLLVAMPLAIVAGHSQAADSQGIDSEAADGEPQSSNFSFVTSVGLTKFDTDLADSLELTDENGAGFVFGLGYQLTDELAAEATYGILGKAGVNTGWVDYSSLAFYLQYRPELVSYGKLRGQFKLGMNRVFYDVADGLNIDNKSADVLTFAVGADYEVNGTDAVEFMFTSFAEDVRFYSVGYRHNF